VPRRHPSTDWATSAVRSVLSRPHPSSEGALFARCSGTAAAQSRASALHRAVASFWCRAWRRVSSGTVPHAERCRALSPHAVAKHPSPGR
jgi:hypothetical protein